MDSVNMGWLQILLVAMVLGALWLAVRMEDDEDDEDDGIETTAIQDVTPTSTTVDVDQYKDFEAKLRRRTKKQIEELARLHYNVELDRRKTKTNMIKDLVTAVSGDDATNHK